MCELEFNGIFNINKMNISFLCDNDDQMLTEWNFKNFKGKFKNM